MYEDLLRKSKFGFMFGEKKALFVGFKVGILKTRKGKIKECFSFRLFWRLIICL